MKPIPMRRTALLPLAVVLMFLQLPTARALPRYSARVGQKCTLCHTDPSGGGMRSSYASQFLLPTEMTLQAFDMEALEDIDPSLNDRISIGADLRTLYSYSSEPELKAGNNLFQMQADVYLHVQADERLALHLDRGLSGTTEVYGLAFVLPAGGYLKAGRFAPTYGWRFADHKQFVRDYLGFAPPGHTDVGLELGLYPGGGDISLNAAAFNGSRGQLLDGDNRPAFALRGEARRGLGELRLAAGGSLYRDEEAGAGLVRLLGGPFAYLSWGPVTWLGEWDWERRDLEAGGDVTALATTQELAWQLRPGLDLRATWNLYDPDIDLKTGSHSRVGFGVDILASPFWGVLAMLNVNDYEAGPAFPKDAFDQDVRVDLILHFLY